MVLGQQRVDQELVAAAHVFPFAETHGRDGDGLARRRALRERGDRADAEQGQDADRSQAPRDPGLPSRTTPPAPRHRDTPSAPFHGPATYRRRWLARRANSTSPARSSLTTPGARWSVSVMMRVAVRALSVTTFFDREA